jgi:hypothetical protein
MVRSQNAMMVFFLLEFCDGMGHTSNSVHGVGTNNGQESHTNMLRVTFLDDRHAAQTVPVGGVDLLNLLQEEQVDVKDDHHQTGEEILKHGDGPFFEGSVCGTTRLENHRA